MAAKFVPILILITGSLSFAGSITDTAFFLTDAQKKTFDAVAAAFPVIGCDSLPLAKAAAGTPACLMAKHLFPFAQWIAAKGKTAEVCNNELTQRQQSLTSSQIVSIDLSGVPQCGNPDAPVTIVLYLSGVCHLCKSISCELFREVTTGRLKGTARFAVKPCGKNRADEAITAAAHFNKQWEFISALYAIKIRPDEPVLMKVADSLSLDTVQFRKYLSAPPLQTAMERTIAEAQRNGVNYTPLVFVNGRRYNSYTDTRWIIDAALYAKEALKRSQR